MMTNKNDVTAKPTLVTPAKARKWLDNNAGNRPIVAARVARYAALMKAGKWEMNGETIILGPKEELIDGQHRLSALIEANVSVVLLVARGVPVTARPTIDIGKSRSLPHIITMMYDDETNVNNVASWGKLHARLIGNNHSDMTFEEWSAWREQNRTGIEWVRDNYLSSVRGAMRNAPVAGSLVFAYRTSPMKIREFAEQLRDAENLKSGMPSHTLLQWFINQPPIARRDVPGVARRVLSAALAHVNGETLKSCQIGDRGLIYFAKAHGVDLGRVSHLAAAQVPNAEAKKKAG